MLNSIVDNMSNGRVRVYSGTRPTDANTALSGNTLLAELTFGSTAFPAAVGGTLTANAITQDSAADNGGTASFVRITEADGTTPVADLSVGTSGAELNFQTLTFVQGLVVQITSLVLSLPVGA